MNITEQREAIYNVETAIEAELDRLRDSAGLDVTGIKVQTIVDFDKNIYPALKVNIDVMASKSRK